MSKELTPAQETAKGLAEASKLRMVTIIPHLLEEELADKKIESILEQKNEGYTSISLSLYYTIGFILALKKERPAALLVFKNKRLIGDKRLNKILSRIEAQLNIQHRVEWQIIEKPSYYAVSGTTGAASPNIYGTNGYVEVSLYLEIFQRPTIQKPPKFKRAGHLTDQLLAYKYPKDNTSQLSIFDSLGDATKEKVIAVAIDREELVEGIKLSPSETKLIDCFCKLLHERSQTTNSAQEDYYTGNAGGELVTFGNERAPAPKLAFTLYEITKEYKGGETIGGKDVETVKQILTDLDKKQFLLSYKETIHQKGGGRIERKIEDFRKLVHIVKMSETKYSGDNVELSKKEETVVALSPIFRRQIDSKFILYPNDIIRRTVIAYGSHNVSEIAIKLRDYLMREHANKRYEPQIFLDRLYWQLAEKWMKESRKAKVREYTDKALETVKNLGILLSYEQKPGATGEAKIVFKLDKDWG